MTTKQTKSGDEQSHMNAADLLDALEQMAAPVPAPVPDAIAKLLPGGGVGFYWRAMTMAEVLRLQGLVRRMAQATGETAGDADGRLDRIARGTDVILLKLSFALCDADGQFVCESDATHVDWEQRIRHLRRIIKHTDLETIAAELANLNNEEKAHVGKDSPAGLEAGAQPATP